jgi:hypothetical protein
LFASFSGIVVVVAEDDGRRFGEAQVSLKVEQTGCDTKKTQGTYNVST